MRSPYILFLNSIDNRYKVLDTMGHVYGDGKTPVDAIASARIVINDPIATDWGIVPEKSYDLPEVEV